MNDLFLIALGAYVLVKLNEKKEPPQQQQLPAGTVRAPDGTIIYAPGTMNDVYL